MHGEPEEIVGPAQFGSIWLAVHSVNDRDTETLSDHIKSLSKYVTQVSKAKGTRPIQSKKKDIS